MTAPRSVFTIGHSTHDFEAFVVLLKRYSVNAVADVRSQPHSRLEHFCRPVLEAGLQAKGIQYVFLGRELGARRIEADCYVDGQAAYERIAKLPAFAEGIHRLERGAQSHVIALMCAEKDPLDCHRTILVGRDLSHRGWNIAHILVDGRLESNAEAERRLVRMMGVERTLFEPNLSDEDLIQQAYVKRAKQIAYRIAQEGSQDE